MWRGEALNTEKPGVGGRGGLNHFFFSKRSKRRVRAQAVARNFCAPGRVQLLRPIHGVELFSKVRGAGQGVEVGGGIVQYFFPSM